MMPSATLAAWLRPVMYYYNTSPPGTAVIHICPKQDPPACSRLRQPTGV